jgi:chorismate dehydratase
LDALPLVSSLEYDERVKVFKSPPAAILNMLEMRKVDIALIPSIDLQFARSDLRVLHSGVIATKSKCSTVKLFSKKPLGKITTIACDNESHTSVILAHVVLREFYGLQPQMLRFDYPAGGCTKADAILLVGDKAVAPAIDESFKAYQIDLAQAWFKCTGLGFVFAFWACRRGFKAEAITSILNKTLKANLADLDKLADLYAPAHNWPVAKAKEHLTQEMSYSFDAQKKKSLNLFYNLAHKHDLIRRQRLLYWATGAYR